MYGFFFSWVYVCDSHDVAWGVDEHGIFPDGEFFEVYLHFKLSLYAEKRHIAVETAGIFDDVHLRFIVHFCNEEVV